MQRVTLSEQTLRSGLVLTQYGRATIVGEPVFVDGQVVAASAVTDSNTPLVFDSLNGWQQPMMDIPKPKTRRRHRR